MHKQSERAGHTTRTPSLTTHAAGHGSTLASAAGTSDALSRQLHAIDAWNAFLRQRERRLIDPALSREEQLSARFEIESLRRTHAAVLERVDLALARAGESCAQSSQSPTVVIAHRSPWFADRVRQALEDRGVRVLECTDNGATALGVIIAEQPEYVLMSDRLVMLAGEQLVAQTAHYSPLTRQVVHAQDGPDPAFLQAGCSVLGSRHRPDEVAEALLRLSHTTP